MAHFSLPFYFPIASCLPLCHPPLRPKPPNNILLNSSMPSACKNVIVFTPITAGNIAFHNTITIAPNNNTAAIKNIINNEYSF